MKQIVRKMKVIRSYIMKVMPLERLRKWHAWEEDLRRDGLCSQTGRCPGVSFPKSIRRACCVYAIALGVFRCESIGKYPEMYPERQ